MPDELRGMLDELKKDGARSSAVISRDGLVIAADLDAGGYVETFAIMCATLMGAAVTANLELKRGVPEKVTVESTDGKMLILNAGRKAVVVSVIGNGADEAVITKQMTRIAEYLKKV
ncbi:MAG: roadblock/LC7 domain-containing protein [Methanomassiliicoccales archaeon]|nr:roadblock/LC7 domain-containing protein [Methanomassiliicoccales archaeon]